MANLTCNAVSAVQITHMLLCRMRAAKLRGCFVYTSSGRVPGVRAVGASWAAAQRAPGAPAHHHPLCRCPAAAAAIPNPFSVLYASTKSFLSGVHGNGWESRRCACGLCVMCLHPVCLARPPAPRPHPLTHTPTHGIALLAPLCSIWGLAGRRGATVRH